MRPRSQGRPSWLHDEDSILLRTIRRPATPAFDREACAAVAVLALGCRRLAERPDHLDVELASRAAVLASSLLIYDLPEFEPSAPERGYRLRVFDRPGDPTLAELAALLGECGDALAGFLEDTPGDDDLCYLTLAVSDTLTVLTAYSCAALPPFRAPPGPAATPRGTC